jgi:hypothetical protein
MGKGFLTKGLSQATLVGDAMLVLADVMSLPKSHHTHNAVIMEVLLAFMCVLTPLCRQSFNIDTRKVQPRLGASPMQHLCQHTQVLVQNPTLS